MLILLLVFMLGSAINTFRVYAADEIHVPYDYPTIQAAINASSPGDTIIVHSNTYFEHIIVDKELVLSGEDQTAIIDGGNSGTVVNITSSGVMIRGFKIQNSGNNWTQRDSGIFLRDRQFCYIESNNVENCRLGIYLQNSSHIGIVGNTLIGNLEGIRLDQSSRNNMEYNILVNNDYSLVLSSNSDLNSVKGNHIADARNSGIHIQTWSSNNTIYGNMIRNCSYGILLSQSDDNIIYHNSFIENADQAWLNLSLDTKWDVDWPNGGNYWSDHNNIDVKSGQYQMGPGSDGISDTVYIVETDNTDKYACAGPINYFTVDFIIPEDIVVISNSTISDFQMNATEKTIVFFASDTSSVGFSRVDVPNSIVSGLWQGNYTVLINGISIEFGNWTEGSLTYIYFRYQHSTEEIIIIPEFPSIMILSWVIMTTLLASAIAHRRRYCT